MLMDHLGHYCAFCERPILEQADIFDKSSGTTVAASSVVQESRWPDLLPTCVSCGAAGDRAISRPAAFPDEELTFRTDPDASLFTYTRIQVEEVLVADDGQEHSSRYRDLVVVRGSTPAAKATVRGFALNTPYWNDKTKTIRKPVAAHRRRDDTRIEDRTAAWRNAEALIGMTLESRDADRLPLLRAAYLRAAAASGFWSVWATVAAAAAGRAGWIKPQEMLASGAPGWTYQKTDGTSVRKGGRPGASPVVRGTGVHNPFPGTARGWWR